MLAMFNDQPVFGPQGLAGKDATINGQNTLEIVAGENVAIEQQDGTMTISASGGGTSEEVYSIEETRIGTWVDGKPVYRRVIIITTQSSFSSEWKEASDELFTEVETAISLKTMVLTKSGISFPCPNYLINVSFSNSRKKIMMLITSNVADILGRPGFCILEYTKTTDTAPVNLLSSGETVLTSEVEFPTAASVDGATYDVSFPPTVSYASASSVSMIL